MRRIGTYRRSDRSKNERTSCLTTAEAFGVGGDQDLDRPTCGSASDLRGLMRLFVETGADVRARERVIRERRSTGTRLQLVEDARDAQILLEFGASVERRVSGWVTNTRRGGDKRPQESVTTPTEHKIHVGAETVYVVRDGRPSIVESVSGREAVLLRVRART